METFDKTGWITDKRASLMGDVRSGTAMMVEHVRYHVLKREAKELDHLTSIARAAVESYRAERARMSEHAQRVPAKIAAECEESARAASVRALREERAKLARLRARSARR